MITDDIYLLLNSAYRENFSPRGPKCHSLGDKFSSVVVLKDALV